jgi:hypothetical protein
MWWVRSVTVMDISPSNGDDNAPHCLMSNAYPFLPNNCGSLAMFAAIRRASSFGQAAGCRLALRLIGKQPAAVLFSHELIANRPSPKPRAKPRASARSTSSTSPAPASCPTCSLTARRASGPRNSRNRQAINEAQLAQSGHSAMSDLRG